MAITPPYNDIEMKTAWAEDAATTIPSVPVPGISYRNTGISEETIANGQAYDNIGRSADWNQLLYKISANIVTMQKQGASLLWVSGRTYEQGSLVKDPNNAQIYYRLKAGAGTTRPSSDSTNWQLLQDYFRGQGLTLNGNKIHWGVATATSGNLNNIIQPGIYRLGPSLTNLPTDIEGDASGYYGFMMVFSSSYNDNGVVNQIAYQEANKFSMNVRFKNNADTWSAWTRFGVEFTLDWRSGGDYRAGDLVRDPTSSNLFVCIAAITNSTQRPGLDSTHFSILSLYLIGNGLTVNNNTANKITWGNIDEVVEDIDTVRASGTYRVNESTENNPLKNNLGTTGTLIVLNNSNTSASGTRVLQLLIPSAASETTLLTREASGLTAWNNWRMAATFDALDFQPGQTYNQGQLVRGSNNIHYVKKTAASVCTTEPNSDSTNFESLASNLVSNGIAVLSNGKLSWGNANGFFSGTADEATESGVYFLEAGTDGLPTNNNYFIISLNSSLYSTGSNPSCTQIAVRSSSNNSTDIYTRIKLKQNESFTDWTKIGPAEEVSASDLAGNGLTAANNKLNWGTASNVTNANSVTTPGTYALTSSSTNTPTTNGIMFVVKKPDGTVSQVIFDANTGNTYQRDNTDSTWSSWRNQSYNVGATASHGSTFPFGAVHTAPSDGWIRCAAYSNWRANTVGTLYINGIGIATNHTGQYGSGGQSSGVETFMFIKAGDTFKCDQGSLEQLAFYAVQ